MGPGGKYYLTGRVVKTEGADLGSSQAMESPVNHVEGFNLKRNAIQNTQQFWIFAPTYQNDCHPEQSN